jgi:hypothetical protein|tara:strand:+ start:87 stop:698 length:612 start_codon:yes stop_codon:yes gene_type:complete
MKWKNLTIVILISFYSTLLKAQHKNDTISDWDRTFMPAIQMGYVGHGTDQLSGGLMSQTSIEYRHESNFVLRINYDNLNSKMNIEYPGGPDLTFTGKVSFSDIIGGIGYRDRDGKHNFTGYIEGGIRNYGYPIFSTDGTQVNLDFDSRNIGIMRYTLGYEFALAPKLFLTLETLISHTLESKDFWIDNSWSYGFTLGISAPLF